MAAAYVILSRDLEGVDWPVSVADTREEAAESLQLRVTQAERSSSSVAFRIVEVPRYERRRTNG